MNTMDILRSENLHLLYNQLNIEEYSFGDVYDTLIHGLAEIDEVEHLEGRDGTIEDRYIATILAGKEYQLRVQEIREDWSDEEDEEYYDTYHIELWNEEIQEWVDFI